MPLAAFRGQMAPVNLLRAKVTASADLRGRHVPMHMHACSFTLSTTLASCLSVPCDHELGIVVMWLFVCLLASATLPLSDALVCWSGRS